MISDKVTWKDFSIEEIESMTEEEYSYYLAHGYED